MKFVEKYKKIVFIDEDDASLAPFAAKLTEKKLMEKQLYQIEVASYGNIVLFPEPVNSKITEIAWSYGISLNEHKAASIKSCIFSVDVLVLCMDSQSKTKAFSLGDGIMNVYTLREFLGEKGDIYLPVGGSVEQYESACQAVSRLIDSLVTEILKEDEESDSSR